MRQPAIAQAAEACILFDDMLARVNSVRAAAGAEAVDAAALLPEVEEEAQAEGEGGESAQDVWVPPPPISDELVAAISRRVAAKLKRPPGRFMAKNFIRAAADLCRDDLRGTHWRHFQLPMLDAVCKQHCIDLASHSRKANIEALRDLRSMVKNFGRLELLLGAADSSPDSAEDERLFSNLQLLLQTSTQVGGSSSRSAYALSTVAMAVALYRDPSLDLGAECVKRSMPSSTECVRRISDVRDRIAQLNLMQLDHSRPLQRETIEQVRTRVKTSVADAALAVLRHGTVDAAVEEILVRKGPIEDEQPVGEVDGLKLYLSERSSTGYTGVARSTNGKTYEARSGANGCSTKLGTFDTAVEGAIAYARHRQSLTNEEGEEGGEGGGEEAGEGLGEPEASNGGVEAATPPLSKKKWGRKAIDEALVPEAILDFNGEEDDDSARWLVRYSAGDDPVWVPRRKLPPPMVAAFERKRCAAHNQAVDEDRLLAPGSAAPSGVGRMSVSSEQAGRVLAFLLSSWSGGELTLGNGQPCTGWATYGKTLSPHDAEQQRKHTLLFTHALLPSVRAYVPGFLEIEHELTDALTAQYGHAVELFYAHGLRQSPETLHSTAFDVHTDAEDFAFIDYSAIVKLTADVPAEPSSQMRIVGAGVPFEYGPEAGACAVFRAKLYHHSVEPTSTREHIKVAFFFRRVEQPQQDPMPAADLSVTSPGHETAEPPEHCAKRPLDAAADADAAGGGAMPAEKRPRSTAGAPS